MAEMGSPGFISLSLASSIRQRVKYSVGDVPTVSLNFRAKVDRDVPTRCVASALSRDVPDRRAWTGSPLPSVYLFISQGEEPTQHDLSMQIYVSLLLAGIRL
jgi:hypothetical protein